MHINVHTLTHIYMRGGWERTYTYIRWFITNLQETPWVDDPFSCSKQYYMLCVSPLFFHIEILLYQHGRSALDTSRTLFLLTSTQCVSCRLVMNHLIYVYVLSLKIVYVYEIEIEISLLTKSGPQEGIYK
jgi:hypothetical protein